jgi:ribonucleoside-diphosphate reductase alpha chain
VSNIICVTKIKKKAFMTYIAQDTYTPAINSIPLQSVSLEIWESKYQLKDYQGNPIDKTVLDSYKRVAKALAEVEKDPDLWYPQFLWAMTMGAIPAGRILSNAGANEHKSSVSLINCVCSDSLHDSMESILKGVYNAGLTLRSGSGIGYCFSTIRHKGAYVFGAGAGTNGPLAFMDIFDKACATISSAGGRRGAQMATFEVEHPDILDFILAKREDGRLRKFNLSVLATNALLEAAKHDQEWVLSFPIHHKKFSSVNPKDIIYRKWPLEDSNYHFNEKGEVACEIVKTIPARELWDTMMESTYNHSEPGILFIDSINDLNNNWWCENIQATNPCVTGDTRLHTSRGLITVRELYETQEPLSVAVDNRTLDTEELGVSFRDAVPVFKTDDNAEVFEVVTEAGYAIKASKWHKFFTDRGKLKLEELRVGDTLWIQSGKGGFGNKGSNSLGVLLGAYSAGGYIDTADGYDNAVIELGGDKTWVYESLVPELKEVLNEIPYDIFSKQYNDSVVYYLESEELVSLIRSHFDDNGFLNKVPKLLWESTEDCLTAYVSTFFNTIESLEKGGKTGFKTLEQLREIQLLLINLGVFSYLTSREVKGELYHDFTIDQDSLERYMGYYYRGVQPYKTAITSITQVANEAVYDTTQSDHNAVIFNGMCTRQCGEIPIPPNGACLLGSINLTSFVVNPFTPEAKFNYEAYRKTIAIFTRMLDNVVEVSNMPLKEQTEELIQKRRHGMGYLGLGSAMVMLGITYGSPESLAFTDQVTKELALEGWRQGLALAKEKGPAPIFNQEFEVTPYMLEQRPQLKTDGYVVGGLVPGRVLHASYSKYMKRIMEEDPELVKNLMFYGSRFTHHSSIAPTGTISFSVGNNASNGIEPSFSHSYLRNVIVAGKKTKQQVTVNSMELTAYQHFVDRYVDVDNLPAIFIRADEIAPKDHIRVQAAAQYWIDSSISKTINVATDYSFEEFKELYYFAHESGLKGCTTYRFNPESLQGVLLNKESVEETHYCFTLANGETITVAGDQIVFYDGEEHVAANLYDALKENQYGKL